MVYNHIPSEPLVSSIAVTTKLHQLRIPTTIFCEQGAATSMVMIQSQYHYRKSDQNIGCNGRLQLVTINHRNIHIYMEQY
jgi:hypothetical protein